MKVNPLSWFRSKARKQDWTGFVDTHTHFLPGLDDGPSTLEKTILMLRLAYSSGTREIVATPHMFLDPFDNHSSPEVRNAYKETLEQLGGRAEEEENRFLSSLRLELGAENYVSPRFFEALEEGDLITINDSGYLLLEFPPPLSFDKIELVVQKVVLQNLVPVIAHVERLKVIQNEPPVAERLEELGALLQVNGSSLQNRSPRNIRRLCHELLEQDRAKIIASDGHSESWRPPDLGSVRDALAVRYSEKQCKSWLRDNPKKMMAGLLL